MPVIIAFDSFQMSKTKLKVALYWIKVSILKQFAENFSYLSFGTVDLETAHKCPRISLLSKRRQIIIFNFPDSQQKISIP